MNSTTNYNILNTKNTMLNPLKIIWVLAVTLCSFSLVNAQIWGNKTIKGNGEMTTITGSTNDYDTIKCAGWMDFILVEGKEGNITIEGEENLLGYIITEVNGSDLIIKTENNISLKPSWNKTITITIPFKEIDKVTLSALGDIVSKNKITANHFETRVSGSR
ncbi:DUF2807 domain-containing protein [Lacinutrix neustonica]|uniref:DUF2807 domain-containing protein n=1 Tax=Lacinutrix neustonica TaxID=2980107 RepID=A0A9E8MWM1_9FLAO|nr:DUF2807 domain-containing protein [Lacinutrix neustonica]WAC02873.1 DUF2807 domain-containing protein [Lacinutrix neustonica]